MASPKSSSGHRGKIQVSPADVNGDESDSDSDTESVCSSLSGYGSAGGEPSSKVYIGAKLPPHITKEQISEHFDKYGFGANVRNITIFYDKSTHKSKGCGYVVLTPANCAKDVIQTLNGTFLLDKHRLLVKPYKQKSSPDKVPRSRGKRSHPGKQLATSTSPQYSSLAAFLPQGKLEQDDSDNESVLSASASGEFCKVFVGSNLPSHINSGHLHAHFKEFEAEIAKAYIVTDTNTKQSKGFGFVVFRSQDTAERAIQKLNGSNILGQHRIKVDLAQTGGKKQSQPSVPQRVQHLQPTSPQGTSPSPQYSSLASFLPQGGLEQDDSDNESVSSASASGEFCKVFVGRNLPSHINSGHLQAHFKEFEAEIAKAYITTDRNTKQSKGFGFIVFRSQDTAERAVQKLNGSKLLGQHRIKVDLAQTGGRKQSQPSVPQHVQHLQPTSPQGTSPSPQYSSLASFLPQGGLEQDDSDNESVSSASASGEFCKVFVGRNLPSHINSGHLQAHFKEFEAEIVKAYITTDRNTKQSKGFGFIVFRSQDTAERAVQKLNGSKLLGQHRIKVNLAHTGGRKQSQPSVSQPLQQLQPISPQETLQGIDIAKVSPIVCQQTHSQLGTVSNSVIVENLSSAVSDEEIKVLVGVPIVHCSLEPAAGNVNKAKLQFSTSHDASEAVAALDGKPILGQTIHAYIAPLSPNSPSSQAAYYPVKVTHLPPNATEERLRGHFSIAGEIASCKIHRPGFAHVNFKNQQGQLNAQTQLDGTQLDGYKINITSRKPHGGATETEAPVPPKKSDTVAVKVTNLMPNVQVNDLLLAFQQYGIDSSCIHIQSGNPPYAFINFPSMSEAQTASANLHETYIGGSKIRVIIVSKVATGVQPQTPRHAQLPGGPHPSHMSPTAAPLQEPSGLHLQLVSPSHYPPSFPAPVPVSSSPRVTGQEEKALLLQPGQWNQLMKINEHGSSVFQELIVPFKCNPNVQIQSIMDQLVIRFVGVQDAVLAAYKHVADALNKELHIKDRVKMAALVGLFPNLPSEISQKYGTTISGYHSDSSIIRFDGPPASVEVSRGEIDQIVCRSLKDEVSVTFPLKLLCSVKKRLEMEHIQSHLESIPLSASLTSKVTLCSFSKTDHERAIEILTGKLFENYVEVSSQSVIDRILRHPDKSFTSLEEVHSVALATQENKIVIKGFVKEDVRTVRKLLTSLTTELSVRKVPLLCSTEQAQYLRYVLIEQPSEDAKLFLSSLSANVLPDRSKGGILLSGNPEAIEATQTQILEGPFLAGLLYRCFPFECHIKFLSQIKDHVLKPLRSGTSNFIFLTSETGIKKGGGKHSQKGEAGFTISIFSRELAVFENVCQQMSVLNPCSRRIHIHPTATEYAYKVTTQLERKYRARIQVLTQGSVGLLIHGLTVEELEQCQEAIEDEIDSNHVIKKYIPIDIYQARYLLYGKHSSEMKELEVKCRRLHIPTEKEVASARGDENISITVIATAKNIEAVKEKVTDIIGTEFVSTKFSVFCPQKYDRMWRRRWGDVRKEQQQLRDLLITFNRSKGQPQPMYQRSSSSSSTNGEAGHGSEQMQYTFEIFGPDPEEVGSVKQLIEREENGHSVSQKQISLTSKAISALLKGLSQKELVIAHLTVDLDINKEANVITVTAPHGVSDDVEAAEAQIQKFVGNRAVNNKQITCDDPVVGLILNARTKSLEYLSVANKLAKPHGVSVRPLKRPRIGLMLTGSQAGIQAVEPIIQTQVIEIIKASIGKLQLSVEPIYSQVLSSPEFFRFDTKLQEELCVLCSYPKIGKPSKLLRNVLLQPSPSAHCLKVEICKGNLVHERVDVIVNAANRELKHIGGLAKAIVDAGGAVIQVESDQYIQQNGVLPTGQAVCLGAGELPCKRIIHTVGPRRGEGNEEQLLYFAVYNTLCLANKERLESVALPAISTGVFGVAEEKCAKASMKAIRDFCQSHPDSDIHTVRIVLFLQSAVDAFLGVFDSGIFDESIIQKQTKQSGHVATSSAAAPVPSSTWFWEDDSHSFSPYSPDITSLLTKEYARNPKGSFQCIISGKPYTIDFSTMKQINTATSYARKIQCRKQQSQVAQWFYLDDAAQYMPYRSEESSAIEAMFQPGNPGRLTISGKVYTFDFTRMCQVNTTTNYKRSIQRRQQSAGALCTPSHPTAVDEDTECKDVVPPLMDIVVLLQGPRENLKMAETKVKEKLKSLMRENTIPLPQGNPALEKKLLAIAKKHHVTCEVCEELAKGSGKLQKVLKLKGLASSVSQTTSAVQEEVINHHLSTMQESEIERPSEWQPQTKTTEVFPIPQGTPEWSRVEQKFKTTLPNTRIVQISRIQNEWLWEKYVLHKRRLAVKNSGNVNEKELFHGTRGNNPTVIYESEDGFDMRYSAQGMWGNANYFAVNASYSHGYAYQTTNGSKEMFLVRVLTGDSHDCPSNRSLRMPPPKQSGVTSGTVQLGQMKYDTVTGITGGSRVYMTYDNDKAYPAYLVQYTG